jgi:hypothetical protein
MTDDRGGAGHHAARGEDDRLQKRACQAEPYLGRRVGGLSSAKLLPAGVSKMLVRSTSSVWREQRVYLC